MKTQDIPNNKQTLELTEKPELRYMPLDSLGKEYGFAACVAQFGSMLRLSKVSKDISWNEMLQLTNTYINEESPLQKEFLTLVQQAKILYSKKRKRGD